MPGETSTKTNIAWVLLGLLVALIATNILIRSRGDKDKHTPSQQPVIKDNTATVDPLPVISTVDPFSLTNQHGKAVSLKDLSGQPWFANIIFTRCPTVCPVQTRTVSQLRPKLPAKLNYVSLTTDPAHDTPEILKAFAAANDSEASNWHFLTGPKPDLMKLAVDNLKLTALPLGPEKRTSPNDLFVHSSRIMLIDAQGRVRKHFEYDAPELLKNIRTALEALEKENDR